MKKLILLALAATMMAGCDIRTEQTKKGSWDTGKSFSDIVKENNKIRDSIEQKWHGYEEVIIDSCEYIRKEFVGYKKAAYAIVHKGNCRFCADRRKQELKELVKALKGE